MDHTLKMSKGIRRGSKEDISTIVLSQCDQRKYIYCLRVFALPESELHTWRLQQVYGHVPIKAGECTLSMLQSWTETEINSDSDTISVRRFNRAVSVVRQSCACKCCNCS